VLAQRMTQGLFTEIILLKDLALELFDPLCHFRDRIFMAFPRNFRRENKQTFVFFHHTLPNI